MAENALFDAKKIRRAVAAIRPIRPVYSDILDYYESIFRFQAETAGRISSPPIHLDNALINVKQKEGFPLVGMAEFDVDPAVCVEAADRIIEITASSPAENSADAVALSKALDAQRVSFDDLIKALFTENEKVFTTVSADTGIDPQALGLIVYHSCFPSLVIYSKQLSAHLEATTDWGRGYCPICGNNPGLALLQEDGGRCLICAFCRHHWRAKRIFCPFCDNRDSASLHYLTVKTEIEYRIEVCDNCRTYLKCVDTRKLDRPLYPFLEQVVTLHLDMKAVEQGYKGGKVWGI